MHRFVRIWARLVRHHSPRMLAFMSRISEQFHCRSLRISCLALLLVPCAAGTAMLWPPVITSRFLLETGALCFFGIAVCVAAYVNLVHDERRGYPRDRCALAAVLLLIAIAPHGVLGFMLLDHFLR